MPELPEVETIRRQLESALRGVRVQDISVPYPKVIRPLKSEAFRAALRGARFTGFGRRAKVLSINFSNGMTMLVHLKMTGRLLLQNDKTTERKETEVIFDLADGRTLFYDDIRRFGWLRLIPTGQCEAYFSKEGYGPEPLADDFTPDVLSACLKRRAGSRIKPALMEQTCIAGIGNIYADESLWDARILPTRRVGSLKPEELRRLHAAIRSVLSRAIPARGASADTYRDLYGEKGTFYPKLRAYGREGAACAKKDGGLIKKAKLAGRGTHWCPVHQL